MLIRLGLILSVMFILANATLWAVLGFEVRTLSVLSRGASTGASLCRQLAIAFHSSAYAPIWQPGALRS
jgi:hypothetical protein